MSLALNNHFRSFHSKPLQFLCIHNDDLILRLLLFLQSLKILEKNIDPGL